MAQTIETTLRVGSLLLRVVVVEKVYSAETVCCFCPSVRLSVCLSVSYTLAGMVLCYSM